MIDKNSKIYLVGHRGFVGGTLLKNLQQKGYNNIITTNRAELDLLKQDLVFNFIAKEQPDYVILCAAKVGGILPNRTQPADFLYENLQIQNNVIHGSHIAKVKKLIFLGSSCSYPRECPQPMQEEHLFTGDYEPTNYGYGTAKGAGIRMCQAYRDQYGSDFITLIPTNVYGPGDNFDEKTSHAVAALIRKVHNAKINGDNHITLWGTGSAYREWLYIEDLADMIEQVMSNSNIKEHILNIGLGTDLPMKDLAKIIIKALDAKLDIKFDTSKPDGMPRKLLDSSKLHNYGIKATTELESGIKKTYQWFLNEVL